MNDQIRNDYPEYPLSLALFDCVPVILFLISGLIIYEHFDSTAFLIGVLAAFAGGSCKALWKMIVVLRQKDLALLTRAFRIFMFGGFGLMLAAVIAGAFQGRLAGLPAALISMPSAIFFLIGAAGMCLMGYLGSHMDKSTRSNWIEEITNSVSQAAFLIGLIML